MLIRDCVLKYVHDDAWLYHTRSSYKVRMNAESVEVLNSMIQRSSPADMTDNEKLVYDRLLSRGIAAPDTGREQDRLLVIKKGSPLEIVELEFSGRCNLHCTHCFAALSQKDMDRELLDRIFEGIDALEPVSLVLNGGEPLLNPLLPEVL
ncbi:MAG TPA: hypothetical protein VHO84_06485, partial [Syntrophorhabdaceae bacterium]|nr:hypothetical protein [Syntrophorhabdaceae bacterium]